MMKKAVYADNAATSRVKPSQVWEAMENYMKEVGASPGRGGYALGLEAGRIIFSTRQKVARFFNGKDESCVVFSLNVTHALNLVLKGFLTKGDHAVISSMEHNAAARPLQALKDSGLIDYTVVQCTAEGKLFPEKIAESVRPNTKMLIINHASNVTGTIAPAAEIGEVAQEYGLYYVLDCAQTAGTAEEVDIKKINADVIAFTGHKGLLGPQGVGGCLFNDKTSSSRISSVFQGGTGSKSDMLVHPDFMPDKLESGTPNTVGIAGLGAALDWLFDNSGEAREHEKELTQYFLDGLKEMSDRIVVYGPKNAAEQTPVVSINIKGCDGAQISFMLDSFYGVMTRSGLHCSPLAHKTIGTFPEGTVRFSFGVFNTQEEINYILNSLQEIIEQF